MLFCEIELWCYFVRETVPPGDCNIVLSVDMDDFNHSENEVNDKFTEGNSWDSNSIPTLLYRF